MMSFLKNGRQLIKNQIDKVCLILGNESCDLDSAVSAIALAYFYSKIHPENTGFLPILNISRSKFPIKTEVSYFLKKHDITEEYLLFKDDTTDEYIRKNSVILVDHHVSPYRECIIEVFDHRPFDKACGLPQNCKTTIEPVGSCATLIGDFILKSKIVSSEFELVLRLLYGAIVMDTVNFSPEACRKTELDSEVATKIEDFLGISDRLPYREQLFAELVKARADTSTLTALQLLYKDMKIVSSIDGGIKVGIPGYPMLVQDFLNLPDAKDSVEIFAKENNCSVILLIGMKIFDGSNVARDIGIVNINNNELFQEILAKLLVYSEPHLQLKEIEDVHFLSGRFFQQQNIKPTRKQILPIVKNILDEKS